MQYINSITDAADQLLSIPLPDGSNLQLEIFYRPGIQRWSANLTHPLLTLNSLNLCLSPNLIRQWRNVIPFGLAITSNNGLDPMQVEDFNDGTCKLYILSQAEVALVESQILAPVPLVNA